MEKPNPNNLHVVSLKSKSQTKEKDRKIILPPQSGDLLDLESITHQDFEGLAKKLEKKINQIENDLKDSLNILESDVQKIITKNGNKKLEPEIKEDLANLSQILEGRIKTALNNLIDVSKNKVDRDELKLIKNLSSNLMRILTFDFYKNVMERLQTQESTSEVDEFGLDPKLIQKIRPLFDFLYFKYWRIKTTGLSNIPNKGKALIVANHSGTIPYDGAMLKAAILNEHPIRKDARFLVEDFVFHMPFMGGIMYRIGGVRACPENAERLLEKGHLVIVFPEGVKGIGKYYHQRYKLQRFGRGGFIKLCIKTKSPLIPVGIVGAEEIHPIIFKSNTLAKAIGIPYLPITPTFPLAGLLGMVPLPSKWSIHFGKPMYFDIMDDSTLDDEIAIHKMSEKVRGEIQQILIDLLKKRRSPWFG